MIRITTRKGLAELKTKSIPELVKQKDAAISSAAFLAYIDRPQYHEYMKWASNIQREIDKRAGI